MLRTFSTTPLRTVFTSYFPITLIYDSRNKILAASGQPVHIQKTCVFTSEKMSCKKRNYFVTPINQRVLSIMSVFVENNRIQIQIYKKIVFCTFTYINKNVGVLAKAISYTEKKSLLNQQNWSVTGCHFHMLSIKHNK